MESFFCKINFSPIFASSFGEVAEWSIAAVLKTVELRGSGGSNPSLSAKSTRKKRVSMKLTLFFAFEGYE